MTFEEEEEKLRKKSQDCRIVALDVRIDWILLLATFGNVSILFGLKSRLRKKRKRRLVLERRQQHINDVVYAIFGMKSIKRWKRREKSSQQRKIGFITWCDFNLALGMVNMFVHVIEMSVYCGSVQRGPARDNRSYVRCTHFASFFRRFHCWFFDIAQTRMQTNIL